MEIHQPVPSERSAIALLYTHDRKRSRSTRSRGENTKHFRISIQGPESDVNMVEYNVDTCSLFQERMHI
jgi:hypothetical protein